MAFGVITEQGDLGLGFKQVSDSDRKTVEEHTGIQLDNNKSVVISENSKENNKN